MNGQKAEVGVAQKMPRCESICVVSGKGGTGKTLMAASLAYALQQAGHRVCLVDSDLSTQGLSLYILGRGAERGAARLDANNSLYHVIRDWSPSSPRTACPKSVDRADPADHGTSYDLIVSNKQFYDRRMALGGEGDVTAAREVLKDSMSESDDQFRRNAREALPATLDALARSGQFDYVLLDTRGGFGELSITPAVFADSVVVVAEPDFTSFHQIAKLLTNIDLLAMDLKRKPVIRGMILNKSTQGDEIAFRTLLAQQFGLPIEMIWPIPLDATAPAAYREQRVPYRVALGSQFSRATLHCFTEMFDLVTAEWAPERKARWRDFVNAANEAFKKTQEAAETARRMAEEHEAEFVRAVRAREELSNSLETQTVVSQRLKEELEQVSHKRESLARTVNVRTTFAAVFLAVGVMLGVTWRQSVAHSEAIAGEFEEARHDAEKNLAAARNLADSLRSDLETNQDRLKKAQLESDATSEKLRQSLDEEAKRRVEIVALESTNKDASDRVARLQAELDVAASRAEDLIERLHAAEASTASTQAELKAAIRELDLAVGELERERTRANAAESLAAKTEADRRSLAASLKEAEEELENALTVDPKIQHDRDIASMLLAAHRWAASDRAIEEDQHELAVVTDPDNASVTIDGRSIEDWMESTEDDKPSAGDPERPRTKPGGKGGPARVQPARPAYRVVSLPYGTYRITASRRGGKSISKMLDLYDEGRSVVVLLLPPGEEK